MRRRTIIPSAVWLLLAMLVVGLSVLTAAVPLKDDPAMPPVKAGTIRGIIQHATGVKAISLVSRVTGRRWKPASWNATSGVFTFAKIPGDGQYDICLVTKTGRAVEGIDLQFVDSYLLRLAEWRRKQLKLPAKVEKPFTAADATALQKHILDGGKNDFMNYRRVWYIAGDGPRVTVLVELMRTREFHESAKAGRESDLVWRVELWYFRRRGGGWERLANVERVLHRKRCKPAEWRKIDVEYRTELSVFVDRQGQSRPVKFTLAKQTDERCGRPANTKIHLKTKPYLITSSVKSPAVKATAKPVCKDAK